jgi:hypothetical protein
MPTGSYQSLSEAPTSFELKDVKLIGAEGKGAVDNESLNAQEPLQGNEELSKPERTGDLLHWSLLAQVQHIDGSTASVVTI